MTCTFADGVYVVFSAPVPQLQSWENRGFNFTVFGPDDSACGDVAYFSNVNDGLRVHHGSQSASWRTPIDNEGYELSCGSESYTGNSDDSFGSCGPEAVVPRFTYSRTGPPYTFTLSSAASESPLFICE